MSASDAGMLIAVLVLACTSLAIGLYVSIYSLHHSLNIIKTKRYQRPLSGQVVTGQSAVMIGVIRALVAGFALVCTAGVIVYFLYRLFVSVVG